jgi:hypothetical protein
MAETTPDTPPGGGIDPFKSMFMKIAGTLMLAPAGLMLCLFVFLAFVDPAMLGSWMVTDPVVVTVYLVAAAGLALILYARHQDRLYREAWQKSRRSA